MPDNTAAVLRALNDLLQLDHDAIRSYQVAIDALSVETLKRKVRQFKKDHQRHVREITDAIRSLGGTPVEAPHVSTGFLKLAVQSLGAAGGERAVLLAFRANEWESARKYTRLARRRFPAGVREVVRRAAQDEEKHHRWAVETLEQLGAGDETVVGRIEHVLERLHGGAAMGMEALERTSLTAARGRGNGTWGKTGFKGGRTKEGKSG